MMDMIKDKEKKKPGFQVFTDSKQQPVYHDLDCLLSMAYQNEPKSEEKRKEHFNIKQTWKIPNFENGPPEMVGGILTILMGSFMTIEDPILEKKCLSLIMRVYSQRQDFVNNVKKMELIFDTNRESLYEKLKVHQTQLVKLIE